MGQQSFAILDCPLASFGVPNILNFQTPVSIVHWLNHFFIYIYNILMVTVSAFIGQLNLFTLRFSGKICNNYPHGPLVT